MLHVLLLPIQRFCFGSSIPSSSSSAGADGFLAEAQKKKTRHDDDDARPPALRRAVEERFTVVMSVHTHIQYPSPPRGEGALRRRRSAVGNTWVGWGLILVDFFLGWQVTFVPFYARRPFPSKETRRRLEGDDPDPPVVPGGQGIGLGSRNLERAGR
jgi:hypothetical protein